MLLSNWSNVGISLHTHPTVHFSLQLVIDMQQDAEHPAVNEIIGEWEPDTAAEFPCSNLRFI